MDERLINRVADEVLSRIEPRKRALCIGTPPQDLPFEPAEQAPYEAVVLCSLSPAELLRMPTDPVCRALLEGKPVYLLEEGLEHRNYTATRAKALMAELMAKERQLRHLGVLPWVTGGKRLYTAEDVRRLGAGSIPPAARLTPLARDLLEGRQ